jgi:hypothetical protein
VAELNKQNHKNESYDMCDDDNDESSVSTHIVGLPTSLASPSPLMYRFNVDTLRLKVRGARATSAS